MPCQTRFDPVRSIQSEKSQLALPRTGSDTPHLISRSAFTCRGQSVHAFSKNTPSADHRIGHYGSCSSVRAAKSIRFPASTASKELVENVVVWRTLRDVILSPPIDRNRTEFLAHHLVPNHLRKLSRSCRSFAFPIAKRNRARSIRPRPIQNFSRIIPLTNIFRVRKRPMPS